MPKLLRCGGLFAIALLANASLLVRAQAQNPSRSLYVSPQGRPDWSGDIPAANKTGTNGPLPTLQAARDRIRKLRASGIATPFSVFLRSGTYLLTETLVLTPEDSRTGYAAYPGEHPVISGGPPVTGWKSAGPGLWTASVSGSVRQLFIAGRRAQRSRLPSNGFYRIDGPSAQTKPFSLKYRSNEINPTWERKNVEVVALLAWAELRMPIASVDRTVKVATLAGNPQPSNREANARYWIENAPEGLNIPGAWIQDADAGSVTYRPLRDEDVTKEEIIDPRLTTLIQLQGSTQPVRDVTFRGLDFRYADWATPAAGYAAVQAAMDAPSAFEAVNAQQISIEHCTFSRSGGYAIWFRQGARNNRIANTEIFDMGGGGIKIGEMAFAPGEAGRNSGNTVVDNDIHDLGLIAPSAIGVWIGQSSDNTVSHNHIHDLYYTAISVGWTWGYAPNPCARNRIEANHLHDIGKGMLSDMGAIYTLGVQPGAVIRNNLIHDVESFSYGGWGIYTDEGSSGILIENNIVYRTKSAGFHQHYGKDNVVRNNIFAFGSEFQLMRTRAEAHRSFTFENNIVYFDRGALLGSDWSGDQFDMNHNVYWNTSGTQPLFAGRTWDNWRQAGHDKDSLVADPLFRNPSGYDFHLQPESPALKAGFRPIDLSAVGPRSRPGAGVP